MHIDHIKRLAEEFVSCLSSALTDAGRIAKIKRSLGRQVMAEFNEAFGTSPIPDRANANIPQLTEACLVFNVLEPEVKTDFTEWYINLALQEYKSTYDMSAVCCSASCVVSMLTS